MAGEIDRNYGTRIYVQLREILRAHIVKACPPGSALPSERDLAERFGLARMTVRQAIDALVGEEVIERVVGLGTFVRKPKLDLQVKLTSYSEEMQRRAITKILGLDVPTATAEDTIIAKLEWAKLGASDRQLEDVAGILRVRGADLDFDYIERWVTELELAEPWRRARAQLQPDPSA